MRLFHRKVEFVAPPTELGGRIYDRQTYIYCIVVHPGFLSQGVGEVLMRDLLDWAVRMPRVEKIELLVRSTNRVAIRLYRKLGFTDEGRLRRRVRLPDGTFVDDIAMAWFPERK